MWIECGIDKIIRRIALFQIRYETQTETEMKTDAEEPRRLRAPPPRSPAISAEAERKAQYEEMIYNILPAIPIWEYPNCKRTSGAER